jgi:hypothetical protein
MHAAHSWQNLGDQVWTALCSFQEEEKKSLHGHKLRVYTNPNPTQPKSTNERIEEFIEHGRRFSGDQRSIREQIHRSSYTLLASILLFVLEICHPQKKRKFRFISTRKPADAPPAFLYCAFSF